MVVTQNSNLINETSLLSELHELELTLLRKMPVEWARANGKSVDDSEAGLWLLYPAKSGGIMFISADYGQAQLKPDKPWPSKDAKEGDEPPKYRTPQDDYDIYLPQHPTDKAYWGDINALKERCLRIDGKSYLVVTEGVIKGIIGCVHGIPTIAGVGVTMFLTPKKKGTPDLVPGLKRLAEAGFGFIIAFDSDTRPKTVKDVKAAEQRLAQHLKAYGCNVLSVTGHWEETAGKGMDDYINKNGIEAFRAILMKAEPIGIEPRDTADDKPKSKSRNKYLLDKIESHWGERLRLNEMTQQIELNGRAGELDIERVYLRLADELGIDIPKQTASDVVTVVAQKYAYSPVRDYLNSLAGIEPINLDSLAERYFGTNDPLHATLLKRTLIAAVARVFQPGCKVDTLCILQGGQGTLKSTFWQTLIGDAWFTDSFSEGNEKDEKLKLRRYWGIEFSEFETMYKRKEISQLKAFLSSRVDSLRKPYGKAIEDFPRTSIFVGTTNRQEILNDPTGERRYLVIPVLQRIPIETVAQERDRIWAAATAAYRAREQWWLTADEDELLAEANQGWQSSDTWEEDILKYLELRSTCTIGDILEKPIGLDIGQHGKGEQMRVSDILRRNGWVRVNKRLDGKVQRCWEKQVVTGVVTGVVTEVVTPQNPCYITTLDTPLPPVTTFSPKHSPNSDSAAESEKTNNSQSEESFENRGGNTLPTESKSLIPQGVEPVTTSPTQGGNTSPNTPQCAETEANEHHADMLASKVKEGLVSGDIESVREVMGSFHNYHGQVRGKFDRKLSANEHIAISRLLNPNHKIFSEGDRVVIVEPRNQHEGQHGEVIHVKHGSFQNTYIVKLDKVSHSTDRVYIRIPKDSRDTFLLKEPKS